jgi:glyoxylase-like metal-dependent hydrolase (beta-lactamase superfamily II)
MGLTFGALVCALGAAPADAQTVNIERLSDRVLVANVLFVGRSNVVALSTKKGLVLIDTAISPYATAQLKQEVEKQFGRTDWAYVINTHAHEHVQGNAAFKHVPIIGHENIAGDMKPLVEIMASEEKRAPGVRFIQGKVQELQKQVDGGAPNSDVLRAQIAFWQAIEREAASGFEVVTPAVTFSEDLTLDMGDVTIHAMYFGRGHSLSDVVVYIPEEKVLVSGGVCNRFFPRVAETVRLTDLKRSIAVLDRILNDGVERVVAGHAEVSGRQVLERLRDYYRDLLAGATAAHGQGLTIEKAQAQLVLDQRFPYMRDAQPYQGSREDAHAANVAAVWKLVQQ